MLAQRRRQARRHAEVDQRELDVDVGRLRRGRRCASFSMRASGVTAGRCTSRRSDAFTSDGVGGFSSSAGRRRRSRMRVGVEVPVDRDLLEVRARQLVGDGMKIVLEARRAARCRIDLRCRECARS